MAKDTDSNLEAWIEARQRHQLTHAQVQMALELGLSPSRLGKIDELWKMPLPELIESLYLKRFGRPPAEPVPSIEQIFAAMKAKKGRRREAGAARRSAAEAPVPVRIKPRYPDRKMSETILDFGAPALAELPPEPALETFRQMMKIVILVWNFGSMTFSIWRAETGKDYGSQWKTLMKRAGPEARAVFDELLRRRASAPFHEDQRAVGEWSLHPDGQGSFNFRCEARLPRGDHEAEEPPRPA